MLHTPSRAILIVQSEARLRYGLADWSAPTRSNTSLAHTSFKTGQTTLGILSSSTSLTHHTGNTDAISGSMLSGTSVLPLNAAARKSMTTSTCFSQAHPIDQEHFICTSETQSAFGVVSGNREAPSRYNHSVVSAVRTGQCQC